MKNKKLSRIKEMRTIEATRKKLMGADGKIGTIVKYLGHPILNQTGVDATYINYLWEDPEEDEDIQTIDDETGVRQIGWLFDGLSRGMHLEIKYLEETWTLMVLYKGEEVFREVGGDLKGYHPIQEWEEWIDKLYRVASKKKNETLEIEEQLDAEEKESFTKRLLGELKKRWGI